MRAKGKTTVMGGVRRVLFGAVAAIALQGSAEAALIDRGGGLIYDDVLDITWMQDANYAASLGIPNGRMEAAAAASTAADLEYYDLVRGVTWSDWRLPSTVNSPSSIGWDVTGLSSEMAYMYYVNLGYQANHSGSPSDPPPTSSNYNPFTNLIYRGYWSDMVPGTSDAWQFHFHFGSQDINGGDLSRAWFVRDGDVAATSTPTPPTSSVPEPTSLALVTLGLGLAAIRRRRA